MERLCDLHTHSDYSDGTCSPARLVELAAEKGLAAVALCDHNTVAGLPEFAQAAEGASVEAICGIEVTTQYRETELHILGLGLSPCHYGTITEKMKDLLVRKEASERAMIDALRKDGFDVSYDRLREKTKGGYVNRAHVAAALVEMGKAPDFRSAFRMYLNPDRGYYAPPERFDSYETIFWLKSLGAAVVLAHPFLNLDEAGLRAFLPEAKERGLDGMETVYTKYSPETTALAGKIAEEFGVLHSGGSDYHGSHKPDTHMGVGHGQLKIPYRFWELLRRRTQ